MEDNIIEIPSHGEIIQENVVNVVNSIFKATYNFLNRDLFILVSPHVKSLCDKAYIDKLINDEIYIKIRAKADLTNSQANVIEIINYDEMPKLILKIEEI